MIRPSRNPRTANRVSGPAGRRSVRSPRPRTGPPAGGPCAGVRRRPTRPGWVMGGSHAAGSTRLPDPVGSRIAGSATGRRRPRCRVTGTPADHHGWPPPPSAPEHPAESHSGANDPGPRTSHRDTRMQPNLTPTLGRRKRPGRISRNRGAEHSGLSEGSRGGPPRWAARSGSDGVTRYAVVGPESARRAGSYGLAPTGSPRPIPTRTRNSRRCRRTRW